MKPDFAKFKYAWFSRPDENFPYFLLFFRQEGYTAVLRMAGFKSLGHWFSHADCVNVEITTEEAVLLLGTLGGDPIHE